MKKKNRKNLLKNLKKKNQNTTRYNESTILILATVFSHIKERNEQNAFVSLKFNFFYFCAEVGIFIVIIFFLAVGCYSVARRYYIIIFKRAKFG